MVRHMEKSTIMIVGYLEVPRALVSWPITAKRLAPILRMGCLYSPASQDVLAEKLASPNQQQDASTQSVRRNVPDFKLLLATLDATVVERPSPTDEAPQHLCLDVGCDNEPSRDVLLEAAMLPTTVVLVKRRMRQARGVARRGDG